MSRIMMLARYANILPDGLEEMRDIGEMTNQCYLMFSHLDLHFYLDILIPVICHGIICIDSLGG